MPYTPFEVSIYLDMQIYTLFFYFLSRVIEVISEKGKIKSGVFKGPVWDSNEMP
jgi:hypothetical protein